MLGRFVRDCKAVNTPLAAHFKLSSDQFTQLEEDQRHMLHAPYSNAIESHMYVMDSRPDLAISRFMHNPRKQH